MTSLCGLVYKAKEENKAVFAGISHQMQLSKTSSSTNSLHLAAWGGNSAVKPSKARTGLQQFTFFCT